MTQASRVLALTLAATGALVLLLWALVQYAGHEQQARMSAQRDAYLLRHLRTSAENYLATGLQLEQMQALQDMLEREQAAFAGIVAIDVFNPAGSVLYSTDAGSRGMAVPAPWRALLAQEQPWHGTAVGQRQIGQRFDNDLAQAAGGIVITLSTAAAPTTLAQWYGRSRQLLRWLLAALLAASAAAAGAYAGLHRLGRPYQAAAALLRGEGGPPPEGGQDELARAAALQRLAWQDGQAQCRHTLQQLEALDHEA